LNDKEKLELLCNREKAGEATAYCAKLLYNFVTENNCKVILELGTGTGVSTRAFLLACKVTGGHLWSVDKASILVRNLHLGNKRERHLGKDWGLTSMWTPTGKTDSLDYEWNTPIDLLFIDTSHTYEQTLAELNKFTPFVKYEHKILLHDSLLDGVKMAGLVGGVLKAIKTFLKENPNYDFYETGVPSGLAVLTKWYPNPMVWLFGE